MSRTSVLPVAASQSINQAALENTVNELYQQYVSLNMKLREIEEKLKSNNDRDIGLSLSHEHQIIKELIKSLECYLSETQTKTTLAFTRNKMNEADIHILNAQVEGFKKMNDEIQVSGLIESAGKMTYQLSTARIWARRAISVLGAITAIAATVAVACVLMSPGVHIALAIKMIPTMIGSVLAFLYLRQPATTSTPLTVGPFHTSIAVSVPTTLGVLSAGIFGASLFKKIRITNPSREEAARKVSVNTMNYAVNQLRNKMEALTCSDEVKTFLSKVLDEAYKMYLSGDASSFQESRMSKMNKATLIMREVAKWVEHKDINSYTVGRILASKVTDSDYSFQQLLNAQRNPSVFSNRSSRLFKSVCGDMSLSKQAEVRLSAF